MKKLLFLLVCVCLFSVGAFAQNDLIEVVYLKNGSVIRGTIIEQRPNESIKIQTADGNLFVYKMEEIDRITKEKSISSEPQKKENKEDKALAQLDDAQAIYRGYMSIGGGTGEAINTGYMGAFNFVNGVEYADFLYAGIGVGVRYYTETDSDIYWEERRVHTDKSPVFIPIFLRLQVSAGKFLQSNWNPYAYIDLGRTLEVNSEASLAGSGNPGCLNTGIGIAYKGKRGGYFTVALSRERHNNIGFSFLSPRVAYERNQEILLWGVGRSRRDIKAWTLSIGFSIGGRN